MKKQKLILAGIALLIALAGIAHVLILYIPAAMSPWACGTELLSFLWLAPYTFTIIACMMTGLPIIHKKKHLLFMTIPVLIALVGAVHVWSAYESIANDPYTSAPASVALLWLIPYGLAIAVCLTVGMILIHKKQKALDFKSEL